MSVVLSCGKVLEPVTISFVGAVSLFMNCPRRSKLGLTLSGLQDSPCEVRFADEKWSMSGTPSVCQVFCVTISCTFCSQGGHHELISFSVTHKRPTHKKKNGRTESVSSWSVLSLHSGLSNVALQDQASMCRHPQRHQPLALLRLPASLQPLACAKCTSASGVTGSGELHAGGGCGSTVSSTTEQCTFHTRGK